MRIDSRVHAAVRHSTTCNAQGSVTIAAGGVLPNIHSVLLPKKAKGGKGAGGSVSQEF